MPRPLASLLLSILIVACLAAPATPASGKVSLPSKLPLTELASRLSSASYDCVRGLTTLQCDYRLEMTGLPMKPSDPKLQPWVSGKLTFGLNAEPSDPVFLFDFMSLRLDITSWPALAALWAASEPSADDYRQAMAAFPMPGTRLICSNEGVYLVTQDGKTADRYSMDSVGRTLLWGIIQPDLCSHYGLLQDARGRRNLKGIIGRRTRISKLGGRKCAEYVFKLPAQKGSKFNQDSDEYKVLLDAATGLPLREDFSYKGRLLARNSFSDYVRFGQRSYGPSRYVGIDRTDPDKSKWITGEIDSTTFGTNWFLTREIRLREESTRKVFARMTFSNWRRISVPESFYALPAGVKMLSSEHKDEAIKDASRSKTE